MLRRAGVFLFGCVLRLLTCRRAAALTPPAQACAALPGARYAAPKAWTETDRMNFGAFLKTPTGIKFVLTLHDLTVGRALSVVDRTPFEHGVTGGMSVMLGEIERLAVEGEPEINESEEQ